MPIYLAASTPAGAASHPLYKQRGINDLTQVSLQSLYIEGHPYIPEIAYAGYKANIDAFISATSWGRKKSTNDINQTLNLARPMNLLPQPKVGLLPRVKLTTEQESAFLVKLRAYGPVIKTSGKTRLIILHEPIPNIVDKLIAAAVENQQPSQDYMTPEQYRALITSFAILNEFLATNSYPAYPTESWTTQTEDFMELLTPNKGKQRPTTSMRLVSDLCVDYTGQQIEKVGAADGDDVVMEDMAHAEFSVLSTDALLNSVLVAKPSPVPAAANIGGIADVPHLPGLVFPYFDRMNMPDNVTVRSVVGRHFLRNFGTTREVQRVEFKKWAKHVENISRFKEGGALAHMFKGVDLALATQTRLFIVQDGSEYIGFVLLGSKFSVNVGGRISHAGSAEEVHEDLSLMSSHSVALDLITKGISALKIVAADGSTKDPVPIKAEDVKSAQHLWEEIAKREFVTDSERSIVGDNVGALSFGRGYKQVDVAGIIECFRRIIGLDTSEIDRSIPIYLPSDISLYRSSTARNLAVFGPLPPSFLNTKGSSYPILEKPEADPNEKKDQSGRKGLSHILVALKPLHVAVGDMNRFIKERSLMMDLKERAAAYRNVVFGSEQRDLLYTGLRDALYSEVVKEKSKKRKAEDSDEGPDKKKVATAEELLDSW